MDHASRAKPNAPTVPALNNMYGSRAYGSGSGSNHRVSNAPAMVNWIANIDNKNKNSKTIYLD